MKDLYLDNQTFYIQFGIIPCDTESNILDSKPFFILLQRYLTHIKQDGNPDFNWILKLKANGILAVFKDLLVWDYKEVIKAHSLDASDETRISLYNFVENFYDY